MGAMFGYREPLRSRSLQTANFTRESEFNRIDHAAFARAIWPRDRKGCLVRRYVELANAANFFDMRRNELDHATSSSSAVNTFTKSSAFTFGFSVSNLRNAAIFASSSDLFAARSPRNFSTMICLRL